MRWYKHFTDASCDSRVAELEEYHGLEGYAVYFKLLEMIGAALKKDNTKIRLPARKLKGNLCITAQKLNKITEKINELGLMIIKKDTFFYEIDCPKMLEFRDNSTTKVRTKSAPSEKKVSLEVEVEVEEEVESISQQAEKVIKPNPKTKKGRVSIGEMFLEEFIEPRVDGVSCWEKTQEMSKWNKKRKECSQVYGSLRFAEISIQDIFGHYKYLNSTGGDASYAFNYKNCSVDQVQDWIDQGRPSPDIKQSLTSGAKTKDQQRTENNLNSLNTVLQELRNEQ